MSVLQYVTTKADLKAIDFALEKAVYLTRVGIFSWDASVPVATHQADVTEDRYVAPDAACVGAWVLDGFVPSGSYFAPDARVHRFADKVLVQDATAWPGTAWATTGSWLFEQGAGASKMGWMERAGALVSTTSYGAAIVGAGRVPDGAVNGMAFGALLFSVTRGDPSNGATTIYAEIVRDAGGGSGLGMEMDVTNILPTIATKTSPYSAISTPGNIGGIWLVSGGDVNVNPVTYDANFAIAIGNNGAKFERGIVFQDNALRRDYPASSRAHAVLMPYNAAVEWYEFTTGKVAASIVSQVTDEPHKQELRFTNVGMTLVNDGENALFNAMWVDNAVNFPEVFPCVSGGTGVGLRAKGDDANIHLLLDAKGTGLVRSADFDFTSQVFGTTGGQIGFIQVHVNGFPVKMPIFNP